MGLRVAMLAPIAWRVPPRHYGPWEQFASLLTEGLVERGVDVTLFASGDSRTAGRLSSVVPRGWEEDPDANPKVSECLHISALFERAGEFDLIHNSFDFLPLTYSALVSTPVLTTIHGFSSPAIVAVYEKYDHLGAYIAISDADRHPRLTYLATIHHGIDTDAFELHDSPDGYLLFFGRIHPDKGTADAIEVARRAGLPLVIAGIIQDQQYFDEVVAPSHRRCAGALRRSRRARAPAGRARRSHCAAAPHRLRGAIRLQRRRGDGLWHARRRLPARIHAGARRGRGHRLPGRRHRAGRRGGGRGSERSTGRGYDGTPSPTSVSIA